MEAGVLRHRGIILAPRRKRGFGGERELSWVIEKTRWGSFKTTGGGEKLAGDSVQSVSKDTWMMRYDGRITTDKRIRIFGNVYEIDSFRHDPTRREWTWLNLILIEDSASCVEESIKRFEDGSLNSFENGEIFEFDRSNDVEFEDGRCYLFEDGKTFQWDVPKSPYKFEDGECYEFEDGESYEFDGVRSPILFEDETPYHFEDGEVFEFDLGTPRKVSFENGEVYQFEDGEVFQYEN